MKSIWFLSVFLVLYVTLATGQCPNSTWKRGGNKCYFINREEADLYENIALCNQLNASMVSITSEEENMQVTQLLENLGRDFSFWLGLAQRSGGQFHWFDGSPFVFNSWIEEPNVTYKYFGAYFRAGDWFTGSALTHNNQICSLDLTMNASPRRTHIPAEFRGHCPNNTWRRVGSKCIYFDLTKELNYLQNQALCKQLNATMVSIHSDTENILLSKLSNRKSFWIGLKQISRRDRLYEWEDGSPKSFENWAYGWPNYLGGKYWAAFSSLGGWFDTYSYYQKYPCCQTSLFTQAEPLSTETPSFTSTQFTSTVRTMDEVSKNTESPFDVVTTTKTELPWTASTYDETITASDPGKITTVTENGQKTYLSAVTKDVIQLLKDVIGKLTDIVTRIQKSEASNEKMLNRT